MDLLDTARLAAKMPEPAKEHVRRYLASNGKEGHLGPLVIDGYTMGTPALILATKGRKTATWYVTPITYSEDAGRYIVVGSFGGAPEDPGWFKNLAAAPHVRVQVGDKRFDATASVTGGPERERLWKLVVASLPRFAAYPKKTTRTIPVVALTPKG
jgi:proline iminopeptidase